MCTAAMSSASASDANRVRAAIRLGHFWGLPHP